MKQNLGNYKVFLYMTLSFTLLWAEDFSYSLELNKNAPYVKEPVVLTVKMKQTNKNIVLLLNFDLKKSDNYTFKRLDAKESDTYHNTNVQYTYLIYPLKSGEINIEFNLIKKIATDEGVAYSFSGDRDNVKGLVTQDSEVSLPPVKLNVKALPLNTELVGDFKMSYKVKKFETKPYEPIPFSLSISGEGFPPVLETIYAKELNLTLFKEKAIVKTFISNQKTKSTVLYPMAVSNKHSFDLPALEILAFNPLTQKSYTLKMPKQHFNIMGADKSELVDKIDTPSAFKLDWSWAKSLFSYLLVFSAGFFTAFLIKERKKELKELNSELKNRIEDAKDEKELLQLLLANNSQKYLKVIEKLEFGLYKNGKINFKALKKEAMEL